jgi:hypothetical protein
MRYSSFGFRVCVGVLAAASVLGAAATSRAGSAYDGRWNVVINSSSAECRAGAIPLKIENGSVGYNGYVPVRVSGSVSGNGAVTVRVSTGGRNASGSGHLAGDSGTGTWSGSASATSCSGTWTAHRTA